MLTWSSYTECFYRHLLEKGCFNGTNINTNKYSFKNIIDSSCSNITVYRNTPKSSEYYDDYLFTLPDSMMDSQNIDKKHILNDCKINSARVIYKTQGNQSSRRINSLYYSSGSLMNSIYSSPYENSYYTNINLSKFESKSTPTVNVFNYLSREIVNSLDTICLYDNESKKGRKHVIVKPSGVLNSGIMGLEISTDVNQRDVCIDVNEIFNVYPSCFFSYEENCSTVFMDPFKESYINQKIETSWDGYTLRSKIYNINNKIRSVNEDVDILEIRSDNKSLFSSTIYARNSLGIFVFRYYFDGEWNIKPLNNVSYKSDEKVYYMCVSPYLSDEAVFLKTNNELLVYDGFKAKERVGIQLSNLLKTDEDIIHSICYGMDNNNLVLAGSKLYLMDKRCPVLSPLLLPLQPSVTITSTSWTERNYDLLYPSRHYNKLLSGRCCSFSSYHRKCNNTFWKSFTALETHPVYKYILAAFCGTSNSILIFDLRIPNSPLLDIPSPSAELIGSRFRSLKWHCDGKDSFIFAFSWRQKYPICVRVKIDSSFSNYSIMPNTDYSYEDFVNSDVDYDTAIMFDRTMYLNFTNVDESEVHEDFPSSGPLIETQKGYFSGLFHVTKDGAMANIFHGYLGMTSIAFESSDVNLLLIYTTSGSLLCIDLNGRRVVLNNKNKKRRLEESQIDLKDDSDSFVGIEMSVSKSSGLPLPEYIKLDEDYKYVKIKKNKLSQHYSDFKLINLQDNIVKIQEQHFGDDRMNSYVSVNNCFLNDFKNYRTQKFNSREIFKRLLSFTSTHKESGSVISLASFNKLYEEEKLHKYNVWNPLNNKFDHEYQSEFKNRFVKDTQLCSCSSLSKSIFEQYRVMFLKILNFIGDCDKSNNFNENLNLPLSDEVNKSLSLPPVSADGIQSKLIEMLENNESLTVDKGCASTFADMLLLQSDLTEGQENVTHECELENPLHMEDCQINDVLCVELEKDASDLESIQIVDQVLSSWILEYRDLSKLDSRYEGNRVFNPGDSVENLREHRMKQNQLISQILTRMDSKN